MTTDQKGSGKAAKAASSTTAKKSSTAKKTTTTQKAASPKTSTRAKKTAEEEKTPAKKTKAAQTSEKTSTKTAAAKKTSTSGATAKTAGTKKTAAATTPKTSTAKASTAKTTRASSAKSATEKATPKTAAADKAKKSTAKQAAPKKAAASKTGAAKSSAKTPAKADDKAKTSAQKTAGAKSASTETGAAKSASKTTGAARSVSKTEKDTPTASASSAKSAKTGRPTASRSAKGVKTEEQAASSPKNAQTAVEAAPEKEDKKTAAKSGRSRASAKTSRPQQQAASVEVPTENAAPTPAEAVKDDATQQEGDRRRRGRSRRGRGGRGKSGQSQEAADTRQEKALSDEPAEDSGKDKSAKEERHSKSSPKKQEPESKKNKRKMFVGVVPGEQIEVVITEEGQVQEYYVEMLNQAKTKGNIYKATIHNVDPNLQAAFVSYGAVKNGFLQIDEVHPEYYLTPHDPNKGRKYPLIQKVLKPGQELLVQVVKEPTGTKGAFLTTYLSLPGRFLVLTPGREQIGVSRKVEQDSERARLRDLLEGLKPGPGFGVIVRTVSMGVAKTHLQKDLQFLKRLWKDIRTKGTNEPAPSLIYQEMELTTRAVRDYLTDEIIEIWLDDVATYESIVEVASLLFPRKPNLVKLHKENNTNLFERFNLRRQLDQIQAREVSLPSGGRLVIDPTEALTAIDINSGRSGGKNNFEDMAFRTNMEAAQMIPLQLRLRDIGGQVVVDFIEMRDKSHWREVEKALRNGMKADRARFDVGKISSFGLMEIVRQRLGSSAISVSTEPCPHCKGTGVRRNMEWQCQQAIREIQGQCRAAQGQNQTAVIYEAETTLALYLLNHKRQYLAEMEQQFGQTIEIKLK